MDGLIQDVRFAVRSWVRKPGFAVVVVLTMALAIAGATTVFTIFHGLLQAPLPFSDPDALVVLSMARPEAGIEDGDLSLADLMDVSSACRDCEAIGAVDDFDTVIDLADGRERVRAAAVTPGMFDLLGASAVHGRTFLPADGQPGAPPVVLLGHELWRRMGGDSAVVGTTLRVGGEPSEVVGVMPEGFAFPDAEELWRPIALRAGTERSERYLDVAMVRLLPGRSLPVLREELAALSERLAREHPGTNLGWSLRARPLREALLGTGTRPTLYLLLGAVGCLLLIACANVANLLFARESTRRREMAVRRALGAGGARLVRQLLTESLLLALAGGLLGALLADWSLHLLLASNPEPLPFWQSFGLSSEVLAVSLLVTLMSGLAFGLAPAWRTARTASGRGAAVGRRLRGDGRDERGLQQWLVAAEVALSVSLVFVASLLAQSYVAQVRGDAGFDTSKVLSLRTLMVGPGYTGSEERAAALHSLSVRLEAVPGVERVAATGSIPMDDGGGSVLVEAEGSRRTARPGIQATYVGSTAGFFETLDLPFVAGRGFTAGETLDPGSGVAVVSRSLASALWPGLASAEVVGRRLGLEGPAGERLRVVGVIPDLQYQEFGEETAASRRQLHLPVARAAWSSMAVLVRTSGEPTAVAEEVRRRIAEVDAALPVYDIRSLDRVRRETTWGQGASSGILTYFAVAAVSLAALGIYGIVLFSVSRRRREIGVRLAVGAGRGQVIRLFLGEGLVHAGAGLAVGILAALALARLLEGLLYGVGDHDLTILGAVATLLLSVAVTASWLPAQRAARVDPVEVLRSD